MIGKFTYKHRDYFYFVFRVLVGLLFLSHGVQKLFGAFGGVDGSGATVQLMSLFGLAGIIEAFGGLFIVIGLFTRFTALITAIEMVFAFFIAHAPQSLIPLTNGGEPATLFFASFLIILVYGARKWGLDDLIFRNKR